MSYTAHTSQINDHDNRGDEAGSLVSVIVTAYNQDWVINETLASLAAQTYRPLECILVDDGSRDDSGKVIDDFARAHEHELRIQVIHQKNQGAQGARNNGFRASSGDFIQWLDGDDLLGPHKIAGQANFLLSPEGERYDVVYGESQWIHGLGESAELGEKIGIGPTNDILCDLLELDPFNPPFAYLSRRAVAERTGGWDSSLKINDDVDYFLQIACLSLANGQDFKHLPIFTGYYRTHSGPRISEGGVRLRTKFTYEILRHAENTMRTYGLLTARRKEALARSYHRISNWAIGCDLPMWRRALCDVRRVNPRFAPEKPRARLLQRTLSFWGAEASKAVVRKASGRVVRD